MSFQALWFYFMSLLNPQEEAQVNTCVGMWEANVQQCKVIHSDAEDQQICVQMHSDNLAAGTGTYGGCGYGG